VHGMKGLLSPKLHHLTATYPSPSVDSEIWFKEAVQRIEAMSNPITSIDTAQMIQVFRLVLGDAEACFYIEFWLLRETGPKSLQAMREKIILDFDAVHQTANRFMDQFEKLLLAPASAIVPIDFFRSPLLTLSMVKFAFSDGDLTENILAQALLERIQTIELLWHQRREGIRLTATSHLTEPVLPQNSKYSLATLERILSRAHTAYPPNTQRLLESVLQETDQYQTSENQARAALALLGSPSDDNATLKGREGLIDVLAQLGSLYSSSLEDRLKKKEERTKEQTKKAFLIYELLSRLALQKPCESEEPGSVYKWLESFLLPGLPQIKGSSENRNEVPLLQMIRHPRLGELINAIKEPAAKTAAENFYAEVYGAYGKVTDLILSWDAEPVRQSQYENFVKRLWIFHRRVEALSRRITIRGIDNFVVERIRNSGLGALFNRGRRSLNEIDMPLLRLSVAHILAALELHRRTVANEPINAATVFAAPWSAEQLAADEIFLSKPWPLAVPVKPQNPHETGESA